MMQDAADDLRDRLGFEIEVLRIIAEQTEVVDGTVDPGLIELTAARRGARMGAKVAITVSDSVGSDSAKEILNAVSALTLLSCFKVLDGIVEWILGNNEVTGTGGGTRYTFSQKKKDACRIDLELPEVLRTNYWLWEIGLSTYLGLIPYRHEIVHRHSYAVVDGILRVSDAESHGEALEIDQTEMSALARLAVGLGGILCGRLDLDVHLDHLMKYYSDQIQKIHGGHLFDQQLPLRTKVRMSILVEDGQPAVDLAQVRGKLARIHPTREVLFDLEIVALREDGIIWEWYIPRDLVPKDDRLMLSEHALPEFRITEG